MKRWLIALQALWLLLVLALGGWWVSLVLSQAKKIQDLEQNAGIAAAIATRHLQTTQRMVFWESICFAALLTLTSALLVWMYWRDLQRSRSLQAFFASMTHELKTPLTSIRLQAEALQEQSASTHLTQRLLEDTVRLESQVETALELARIEGGGRLLLQDLPLSTWLKRWARSYEETHPHRLKIHLSEHDSTSVKVDPAALKVILKNLVENSLRHARTQPTEVWIDVAGNQLCFKDNGETPSAVPERLLGELFFRGPSSQGAGVGLYLVRSLIRSMAAVCEFHAGPGFPVTLRFHSGHSDSHGLRGEPV